MLHMQLQHLENCLFAALDQRPTAVMSAFCICWCCLQIIEVHPHAKATVAAAGHEGEEALEGMPVEALLGMDMAHPNVVQTYRHTSLPSMVSPLSTSCQAVTKDAMYWTLQSQIGVQKHSDSRLEVPLRKCAAWHSLNLHLV